MIDLSQSPVQIHPQLNRELKTLPVQYRMSPTRQRLLSGTEKPDQGLRQPSPITSVQDAADSARNVTLASVKVPIVSGTTSLLNNVCWMALVDSFCSTVISHVMQGFFYFRKDVAYSLTSLSFCSMVIFLFWDCSWSVVMVCCIPTSTIILKTLKLCFGNIERNMNMCDCIKYMYIAIMVHVGLFVSLQTFLFQKKNIIL